MTKETKGEYKGACRPAWKRLYNVREEVPNTTMAKVTVINWVDAYISRQKSGCGIYPSAAYTSARHIPQCDLYSSVAYTPVWLILQCGIYPSVAYIPVRLILQCGLYSSAAYTPVWLIPQCGLYSENLVKRDLQLVSAVVWLHQTIASG